MAVEVLDARAGDGQLITIAPFEELERQAREEYRKRFRGAPKPKAVNATAAVELDAPRCFLWGGLTFWVPPLSYEDGLRLWIAGMALSDDPEMSVRPAAKLIHRVLRPRKLRARIRHALRGNPFLEANPSDLESLVTWLTHVPDEAGVVPSSRPVTIDLVGSRYAFELAYKRPPRSWADFIYGMHALARHSARDDLRLATAMRLAHWADEKGWERFESDARAAAGW